MNSFYNFNLGIIIYNIQAFDTSFNIPNDTIDQNNQGIIRYLLLENNDFEFNEADDQSRNPFEYNQMNSFNNFNSGIIIY